MQCLDRAPERGRRPVLFRVPLSGGVWSGVGSTLLLFLVEQLLPNDKYREGTAAVVDSV
jgi:hypothetical protein